MADAITNIDEFIAWIRQLTGRLIVYRGLADVSWEVSASAYRRMTESLKEPPSPILLENYIKQLLNDAGIRGLRRVQDRRYSDLELLSELQHHGAATCLIDFTTNPLVALWFACREKPVQPGKVIAMATEDVDLFSTVTFSDLEKSVEEFLHGRNLWKWEPSQVINRILTQQSVFVFGRGKIADTYYEEIIIESNSKLEIRNELREIFGINEQHLFSDFTGFALSNAPDRPYIDDTLDYYLSLGLEFSQRNEFQDAIDICNQAIALYPENSYIYFIRGTARCGLGDYQAGITDYDKAIEINPRYSIAYNNRGNAKGKLGNHQAGITDFDKAIEINPRFINAYNNRGIAKITLGNYQDAISDFDKAIEIDPQHVESLYNRGLAKYESGNNMEATLDYDKVIEINPRHVNAYINRGITKGMQGNYQASITDYNKAIEISPRNVNAYINRGNAKCMQGNHQAGIIDYDKAIKINPHFSEAYVYRGLAWSNAGAYQKAITDYNHAIEIDPQRAELYSLRGKAKHGLGDEEGAKEDFDRALKLNKKP